MLFDNALTDLSPLAAVGFGWLDLVRRLADFDKAAPRRDEYNLCASAFRCGRNRTVMDRANF